MNASLYPQVRPPRRSAIDDVRLAFTESWSWIWNMTFSCEVQCACSVFGFSCSSDPGMIQRLALSKMPYTTAFLLSHSRARIWVYVVTQLPKNCCKGRWFSSFIVVVGFGSEPMKSMNFESDLEEECVHFILALAVVMLIRLGLIPATQPRPQRENRYSSGCTNLSIHPPDI